MNNKKKTYHSGYKWRFDSSLQKIFPAHLPKELLFLYVLCIFLTCAEPSIGMLAQKFTHDRDGFYRQKSWVSNFIVNNAIKDFFFVVTWEWRLKKR